MQHPQVNRGTRNHLDRAFFVALGIILALYVAAFGYFLGPSGIRVPVYDLLSWVIHYEQTWLKGDWWDYLWTPHTVHRLVLSRFLLLADIAWFGGSTLPFAMFGLACLAGMISGLVREAVTCEAPADFRPVLAIGIVVLLATTYIEVDCSIPQLGNGLHTAALFAVSLTLMDGRVEAPGGVTVRRVCALLLATLACFGTIGGLVALPILAWSAWRGGLGARWIASIIILAALEIVAYLPGDRLGSATSGLRLSALPDLFDYTLLFLGLPWSHEPSLVPAARAIGAAVLVCGGWIVVRRGIAAVPRSRLERIGVGLLMFALLMAAIVAFGRFDVAPDRSMPIRYSVSTALGQVGLLLVASPRLARLWSGPGRRALQAVVLAAAAVLLVQQVAGGRAAVAVSMRYTEDFRRFAAGEWTDEMTHYVFPTRSGAERGLAIVRSLRIYGN